MVDTKLKTLSSLESKNISENSRSTSAPNTSVGENCRVTRNKRKACSSLESPRKKHRGAFKATEVQVEAATAMGARRKSSSERETPKKRQRSQSTDTDTSNPLPASGTKREASTETDRPSKKSRSDHTDTNTGVSTKVSVETHTKKEASAQQPPATETPRSTATGCDTSPSSNGPSTLTQDAYRAFEARYEQLSKLGEGGCGTVYAGTRRTDNLPVAIKHVPKAGVRSEPVVLNGITHNIPVEVLLMVTAAGGPEFMGKSAAITLLDWYDLDREFVLVMERPIPSVDLFNYLTDNDGPLEEDQAKNIIKQLLEAVIVMHSEGVFHRDIKSENILIETGSDVLRVRVIDFGCGCFDKETTYKRFAGTFACAPPEFLSQGTYEAVPTTVWQLGVLLFELLDGYALFTTAKYLRTEGREVKALNVSQDCHDLLRVCLAVSPEERATLEQMQLHPWFT